MAKSNQAGIPASKHFSDLCNAYGLGVHCVGELRALLLGIAKTAEAAGDSITHGLAKVAIHLADDFQNDLDVDREDAEMKRKASEEVSHG